MKTMSTLHKDAMTLRSLIDEILARSSAHTKKAA